MLLPGNKPTKATGTRLAIVCVEYQVLCYLDVLTEIS